MLYDFINKIKSDKTIDLDLKLALCDQVNNIVTNKEDEIDLMKIHEYTEDEKIRVE